MKHEQVFYDFFKEFCDHEIQIEDYQKISEKIWQCEVCGSILSLKFLEKL